MSYVDANATKMVDTACVVCGAPLVAADSVERAVGPHCAKKNKIDLVVGEPDWLQFKTLADGVLPADLMARVERYVDDKDRLLDPMQLTKQLCNWLTWWCAENRHERRPIVVQMVWALGYQNLARAIARSARSVMVRIENGNLFLRAPFQPEAVERFRKIPGRKWLGKEKETMWPVSDRVRAQVWDAIKRSYPAGTIVVGEKVRVLA